MQPRTIVLLGSTGSIGTQAIDVRDLAALATIDRALLNPTDAIAYDVFKFTTEDTLRGYGRYHLATATNTAARAWLRQAESAARSAV